MRDPLTINLLLEKLQLKPLSGEGGFFVETYRSPMHIPSSVLPDVYGGSRSAGTAIYYLLTPDSFSALHTLPGDETYHFYLGDPVDMLQLKSDGTGEIIVLGSDILAGMRLQVTVPGGVWQGSRLKAGGRFALLGTTMVPGFEFADYMGAKREELIAHYPEFAEQIGLLTRGQR